MAISFPLNPNIGDEYSAAGKSWTWNGSQWEGVPSTSGIPFGATADRPSDALGQPFFNGEEGRLELFTSNSGWANINQEPPTVISVSGSYVEGDPSTILTINGSNFSTGAIASVIGQDGTETQADITTLVSTVEVEATFSGLSATNEPYDVKVTNFSNLSGTAFNILQVDDIPIFINQSGSLGTYIEESAMSIQISVTDEEESPLVFSISSGSLPAGLSLNTATGEISGTPTNVIPNTTRTFEISATDGNNTVTRSFSITINDRGPTWGSLSPDTIFEGQSYSFTLSANEEDGAAVSYSIISGSLPPGLSLNSVTGEISGIPTDETTSYVFTARATDSLSNEFSDKQLTIPNAALSGGTRVFSEGYAIHTFKASDTLTVNQTSNVDYLIVAGGGSSAGTDGASESAGGGAGGLIESTAVSLSPGSYPIVVGAGGSGGAPFNNKGTNGDNSLFFGISATGGGAGGGQNTSQNTGSNGGSGGGGSGLEAGSYLNNGGSGIPGQGNDGGSGQGINDAGTSGGGGGAGSNGADSTTSGAGAGGAGLSSSVISSTVATAVGVGEISGGLAYFAGGGGGSSDPRSGKPGAAGGIGGGGDGSNPYGQGTGGASNTGGGAGAPSGDERTGNNGGSGLVIVRYAL